MPPLNPKIYHITHINNLAQIVADGVLWSDSEMLRLGRGCTVVGMSEIKRRRLEELEVDCHPGRMVGEFVPFYLCPRSVMLYLLHRGNHVDLSYEGGQRPIVHLVADLHAVLEWTSEEGRPFAFSKGNAGARYAAFIDDPERLDELDWTAIGASDWRDPFIKEAKQAEFLVLESFPWTLVKGIGVIDDGTKTAVERVLEMCTHRPPVVVKRNWYY